MKKNALVFLVLAVLVCAAFVLFPDTLLAAGSDPFSKIIDKTSNVKSTVFAVAKLIAGIGIIIGGVKKVMGHPDAWTWIWSSALGTIIIWSADAIVEWLQ